MNSKNNNNFKKVLKISKWIEVPPNYSGIIEYKNKNKYWYLNGKRHRTNGPAIEYADGSKFWFFNGERHRTDGPAVEYSSGYKAWYFNGELHRTDGPALEWVNGSKFWYLNGLLHRIDGPAVERENGSKEWYFNGIKANPLFFEIPNYEKYIDYYMTILQTELVEHEEFLLEELKKQVEFEIKTNRANQK